MLPGASLSTAGLSRAGLKLSPVWAVPLARNPQFSGREETLAELSEAVSSAHLLAVVALHGMGGVGKTQLALEYAYRNADRYKLVAWIRAEEPETLAADYCAIGSELHFPETTDERKRIALVRSWLERNDGWLLVFDNAPKPDAIRAFLPRTHTGHILVTSRLSSWRALAASMPVEVLSDHEAVEFLLARTGEQDEDLAGELAQELGRLPLALEEAAAYMEATGRSMASYLPLLREKQPDVLLGRSATTSQVGALRITWELSFRELQKESAEASDLLKLCAYFAPDDIPLEMIRAGREHLPDALREQVSEELSLDACVAALRRYSLVRAEAGSLSIHRLVQLAARVRLPEQENDRWREIALRVTEQAYPQGTMAGAYKPESGRYLPHALAAVAHSAPHEGYPELAGNLLRRTGLYRSVRGRSDLAQVDLERSLRLLESAATPDEAQIALVLWELGMVRYALGEPDAAGALLERSAGIFERINGPRDLWVGQALLAHAWVLRTLGRWEECLALAERSLDIARDVLGEDNEATAMARSVMGRALWSLGRVSEARECVERGTELVSRAQALHPIMCGSLDNLAQIHSDLGEPGPALELVERCLEIGEERWGVDHPFICLGLRLRGSILLRRGALDEARRSLEQALAGGQRACRYLHEDIAVAHSELAEIERQSGDLASAHAHLERAISGLTRLCGDPTRTRERIHFTRAAVLRDEGDLDGARREAEAALAIVEKGLGPRHPLKLEALERLGEILQDLGLPEDAERRRGEAREIARSAGLDDGSADG